MCKNCERLNRELREAREEIQEWKVRGIDGGGDMASRLRYALKIRPQGALIVAAMMEREGRFVRPDFLIEAANIGGQSEKNTLRVQILFARKSLDAVGITDAIVSSYGDGYLLTTEAASELRELVSG